MAQRKTQNTTLVVFRALADLFSDVPGVDGGFLVRTRSQLAASAHVGILDGRHSGFRARAGHSADRPVDQEPCPVDPLV